jgi:hypothetical protein
VKTEANALTRMIRPTTLSVLSALLMLSTSAISQGGAMEENASPVPAALPTTPPDYGDHGNWLCWPGRSGDACAVDLTTTVISADGTTKLEAFHANPKPPIDCFYVYPTVSTDPGLVSTLAIGKEERGVVVQQLARFGSRCRIFAPMYRQVTLTALVAALRGQPLPGWADPAVREVGFHDVEAAWAYYLAHENHRRGVVLIGHSQGSNVLTHLIKDDIDGKPSQKLLVSAILMGANLVVPKGADVGGDFKSIPLCHSQKQTGCVIAYASFRETSPPPSNSRFGRPRTPEPGMVAACVNPAALDGGSGPLHSYLSSGTLLLSGGIDPGSWAKNVTVTTPFVSLPGMLSARCVSTDELNYLAVKVSSDLSGPRRQDIPGDLVRNGAILKDWGLHLIDANLAMGNLVDVVGAESAAWLAKSR